MAVKTYEEVVKEDAPEIFLRLDEASGTTAADATRFGRDFTHSGSPTLDQTGPVSKAVSYDGTDDETTYSGNIPILGYPFTLSEWIKTDSSTSASSAFGRTMFIEDGATNNYFLAELTTDGSNNLNARIQARVGGGTAQTNEIRIPNSLKGEWVHLVVQFVSATERNVYVNGVLIGTGTGNVSFPSNLDLFIIGATNTSGSNLPGKVAEPCWFNYQLGAECIRIHHAVGRGFTDTDSYGYAAMVEGPSLYATLGDASGNAVDSSGFKRDLAVAGAPTRGVTGPLSEDGGDDATTFDGSDDAFALSGDDLGITAYPLTMVMFGKTPAGPANSTTYARMMFGDDGTQDNYFGLDLTTDGSGNPQVRGLLETGGTADQLTGTPLLSGDQFYHLVWRLVSATERHLYVNGVLVDSATTSRAFGSNVNDVVIGRNLASSPSFYAGTIGQVLIYGRDIGASASRTLYAKAKQYLETDFRTKTLAKCPSLYWRQGESSGSTASDETEFGRDGTYAGTGPTLSETGALVDDADTAVQYNGTDDQLTYSEAFITQYPVTLEALVKLPSSIASSSSYIRVGLTDASGTMKMVAGLKTDSNTKLRAHLSEVGSATGSTDNSCGGAIGNYHHLIAEFISDTSRKIWLNGVELEEETASTSVTLSNLDTVCVGVEDLGTDAWYAGYCDEFVLYQRQLSTDEIRDQYVAGLGYFQTPNLGGDDAGYIQLLLEAAPSLFWPLNETSGTTATDATRWGRDGDYSGGVTLDQSGPVSQYKAINTDGVDGKVEYFDSSPDQPLTAFPCTLVFWAKSPASLANSADYTFFGAGDTSTTNDEMLLQLHTDGSGNIYVRAETHQGGGADKTINQNGGTGIAAQNNKFVHCAFVLRSSSDRELFVNGRSAGTDTTASSFPSNLDAVRIGQFTNSGGTYFEGFAAGAVIFPYELTEAQIREQFLAGRGAFEADNPYLYEMAQLVPAAHYRLNEDSGTTAADLLGLRDLTIAGSPTLGASGPIYNVTDDAAITLDGTDDEATLADDAQVTAYPTAYVGWVKTPGSPGASDVFGQMGMGDDGTGNNVLAIGLKTDGSSNVTPAGYLSTGGTADNAEPTTPVLEAGVFHHIIWVQRSATDRELYVNGASVATDTTSRTFPSSLDDILLGRTAGSTFREGTIAEFSVLTSDVSDSEALDLYLAAFTAQLLVINTYERTLVDGFSLDESTSLLFVNTIEETLGLSESIIIKWSKSLVDAFGLHDALSTVMLFKQALTEGFSLDDTPSGVMVANNTIVDGLGFDDTASATAQLKNLITEGISFQIGLNLEDETYSGLVINTKNFALSRYTGYNFNSFAKVSEDYFGAAEDGIYHLEGDDDAGTQINAAIKTAAMNFGTDFQKRVPRAYLGLRGDGELYLKTITNEDEEFWYRISNVRSTFHNHRARLGRGVKATYWQFELSNEEDGSFFELDSMTLIPVLLTKRVKC